MMMAIFESGVILTIILKATPPVLILGNEACLPPIDQPQSQCLRRLWRSNDQELGRGPRA